MYIDVGEISGVFGVKGWVKVFSFTDPRENILAYSPWRLQKGNDAIEVKVFQGRVQGKSVVASLTNIEGRDAATLLIGYKIQVHIDCLPKPEVDEYYWHTLIGLQVVTTNGVDLGTVATLIETGANDVLVVQGERERLIPFIQADVVLNIDLTAKTILVDWDPEF